MGTRVSGTRGLTTFKKTSLFHEEHESCTQCIKPMVGVQRIHFTLDSAKFESSPDATFEQIKPWLKTECKSGPCMITAH